jgi:phosphatidylglycerophosphate synthase
MLPEARQQSRHQNTFIDSSLPLGILNACSSGAWKKVGGIPVIARTLFHLDALGLKKVVLLWEFGHPPQNLNKWQGSIQVEPMQVRNGLPEALQSTTNLADDFLYIDASHLIDPRLLKALMSAPDTTLSYLGAADRDKQVIRAGLLSKEDLLVWASQGITSLVRRAAPFFPEDIDPFRQEIRGEAIPYFLEIRTNEDVHEATQTLIRNQQKQAMDFPAQYIHPLFENALTSFLLKTPISPDLVTIIGASVAFLVTLLFWYCYFVSGAFLTFVVNILDGVDGKLARTKLQFSWLGKHEDIVDYFYENSWYVALGVGLHSLAGDDLPLLLAAVLVLADTADNVFYTLAGKWHGKSIDLFSPFDRNFRLIAGRRNIYGAMFMIGFSLGYPLQTFITVTIWALATAMIHGIRLRQYSRSLKSFPMVGEETT